MWNNQCLILKIQFIKIFLFLIAYETNFIMLRYYKDFKSIEEEMLFVKQEPLYFSNNLYIYYNTYIFVFVISELIKRAYMRLVQQLGLCAMH